MASNSEPEQQSALAGTESEAAPSLEGADVARLEAEARGFTLCLAMAALRRLDELSKSEDEKVAFTAIQEILNRALGKIAQLSPQAGPRQPVIRIVNYADWLERQMERKDG